MPNLNPDEVRKQIAATLLSCPELADDEQLRADTIEGATDAHEFLSMIARQLEETDILRDGLDARINELKDRAGRFDRRAEALRELALRILLSADLTKVELPTATLSTRRTPPKLLCDTWDEDSLLDKLVDDFIKVTRSIDKAAIKKALEAGQHVPGFTLSNGGQTLNIRVR